MKKKNYTKPESAGQIIIECPNTIFHIYVHDEQELSKIEIFMGNIRTVKHLGINDIYNWCNRQGVLYHTQFNYHKDFSLWKNLKSYFLYSRQNMKYQIGPSFV